MIGVPLLFITPFECRAEGGSGFAQARSRGLISRKVIARNLTSQTVR
jgi:hypothetical protein